MHWSSQCEEVFAQGQNLSQHIKAVHKKEETTNAYSVTGSLQKKPHLTRHIKHTHQNEKNHECKLSEDYFT